jgi:putative hydrolase of the HAD superfamily
MQKLVLVDFDDTLVETAPAFQNAREALFRQLAEEGFSLDDSHRVHHGEVDPELLSVYGMGPFRMEPSFRETYLRLCREHGREPDPDAAERCAALGRDFMGKPKVMDGSLEALERLAAHFPTVLFSQAAQWDYQMGRVRDAGVAHILGEDRIRITARKTPESFREVLRDFGVEDSAGATMIGNSLRSDINPALTVGAGAILVEPYEMWHYDEVPPVSSDFLRFATFPDAVDFMCGPAGSGGGGATSDRPRHSWDIATQGKGVSFTGL